MSDNITLAFDEYDTLSEKLEQFIPDTATCISVKINVPDYDPSDNNFIGPSFGSIVRYLKDSGVEILACSSGIHIAGRKEIPHVHYHFIANHYNEPSNSSGHRKRWLAKKGNEAETFNGARFKYDRLDASKPKYQFLAYPLKEGIFVPGRKHYLYNSGYMDNEMKNFLLKIGREIYEISCALRLRQDKCTERKQLALSELYEICSKESFSSYKAMMLWLDEHYIDSLELNEMPDPKNYKTNCQKIAVKLKLLKYSDI